MKYIYVVVRNDLPDREYHVLREGALPHFYEKLQDAAAVQRKLNKKIYRGYSRVAKLPVYDHALEVVRP